MAIYTFSLILQNMYHMEMKAMKVSGRERANGMKQQHQQTKN